MTTTERQPLAQEAPRKPNILLVLTDDQDVDSLSEMPNVRSLLAEQGTTFSRTFVTTTLCCPSRASILRGQYAHNHGVWSTTYPVGGFKRFRELGHESSTVATWLHGAGYETGFMGKYFQEYGSYNEPTTHIPPGWDRWIGFQGNRNTIRTVGAFKVNDQGSIRTIDASTEMDTDYFAREAETFIRNRTADTPWFLAVSTPAPHGPAVASERNEGTYAGLTMPRTPNFNEADVSDKASIWQQKPLLTDECPPDYQTQPDFQCIPEADEVWRDRTESLRDVDEMVARLVQALDEKGFARNTHVVYTSDNGFGMYENRIYSKAAPYERSQKVPLIVRGPGVTPGHVDERLVANIDLAPTFAEWAGVQTPDFVDGRSFAPLLGDPTKLAPWRTRLLFEWRANRYEYEAVRTDSNRVYIEYPLTSETEYYDLTTDPYQLDGKAQAPPPEIKTPLGDLADCAGEGCRAADRECSTDLMDNDGDGVVDEPGESCGDPRRPPDTAVEAGPDSLTSSTSAPFTFYSSKAGSTFECSLDGAPFAACNPENNTLNSKTYDNLTDGEHTFYVKAKDGAGYEDASPAQRSFTVDTRAPDPPNITDPHNNSYVNDGAFTAAGTAEANSSVELFEGATSVGTTTADGSGDWSVPLSGVAEGSRSYTTKATDAAGNASSFSSAIAVTVDTTRPAPPSKPDLAASSDTGTSTTDNLTRDTTPTLTGTAEANSTVKILVDGVQKGSARATASGTYSITTSALTPAPHSVSATATDTAGNVSPRSLALAVTIDTRKPMVSGVTSPTTATGNLTATFSERMNATTINGTSTIPSKSFKLYRLVKQSDGTIRKVAVKARVIYMNTTTISKATLDPDSSLLKGNYGAQVTSVATDLAGNALDQNPTTISTNEPKTWRFTI